MWELDFAGLQYELERYGYFPISDKDIDKLDKAKEIIRRYLDGANGKDELKEALRLLEEIEV